ncbi:unnamed protein product [Closterium sp. NIES-54]
MRRSRVPFQTATSSPTLTFRHVTPSCIGHVHQQPAPLPTSHPPNPSHFIPNPHLKRLVSSCAAPLYPSHPSRHPQPSPSATSPSPTPSHVTPHPPNTPRLVMRCSLIPSKTDTSSPTPPWLPRQPQPAPFGPPHTGNGFVSCNTSTRAFSTALIGGGIPFIGTTADPPA